MPVEIREVVIRAELIPRPLDTNQQLHSTQLTPELFEAIQAVCAEEFQQWSDNQTTSQVSEKFQR